MLGLELAKFLLNIGHAMLWIQHVRPDMRYCFRSGRFHPDPRMKHIPIPPRHMTLPYAPDFNMISQHYSYKGTTTHTTGNNCLNTIHQRKIHVWVQTTIKCLLAKRKSPFPNHTGPGSPAGSAKLVVVESPRETSITKPVVDEESLKAFGVVSWVHEVLSKWI